MEENRKVLIRLLKDGHITDVEFQSLYDGLEKNPMVEIRGSSMFHMNNNGTSDPNSIKYRTWTS